MSFFVNPFASTAGGAPVFATSPLHPLPSNNSIPLPANLRRSSLRAAAPASCDAGHSSASVPGTMSGSQNHSQGGVQFISPFNKGGAVSPGRAASNSSSSPSSPRKNSAGGGGQGRSRSHSRALSNGDVAPNSPGSRRASLQGGTSSPLRSPAASTAHGVPFFSNFVNPNQPAAGASSNHFLNVHQPDFSRRRSVDVGVLGLGTHRLNGVSTLSKRVREAVGPDAGDKEIGLVGAGAKGGKDRLLGRHLASLLAHSLSLCADPPKSTVELAPSEDDSDAPAHLAAIPGSPSASPVPSRNTSVSAESMSFSMAGSLPSTSPPYEPSMATLPSLTNVVPSAPAFPVLSEAKRFKLINNLQSWTFNAMSYTSDELLSCVGIIFESVRNMEGVQFDLGQFKMLLLSLRSAYHARNGYHNFSHAADVTQACYSFLVRMGLAPPLYLLCEDDYDPNLGEGRRKWRRNRAVEEGGMGELLRPMDVFALMVAAIGHDVGHPGLSNAYMVNARTPVAQVYEDKSVLENFHTVTLIHMLRRHNFDYLLGGDFGHLGDQATSFRKVLEASILATDMSRHFAFVTQLTELGRRFGERRGLSSATIEADRLLLCSGLMKCADISNPTRPHRISRAWSTALLEEWTVQAAIETEFGLPVSVMTLDPADKKGQAKSQVGFIDLFAKPLFNAMAGVVDEFADFAEKLRDGRIAWEAISLQTDEAFSRPVDQSNFRLSPAPTGRSASRNSNVNDEDDESRNTMAPNTPVPSHELTPPAGLSASLVTVKPVPVPVPQPISAPRPTATQAHSYGSISRRHHGRNHSGGSSTSTNASPLSPSFPGSVSSVATGTASSFSISTPASLSDALSSFTPPRYGPGSMDLFTASQKSICGGACHTATAMCEVCSKKENARRGSLGMALAGIQRDEQEEELYDDEPELEEDDPSVWPPYPFMPACIPMTAPAAS